MRRKSGRYNEICEQIDMLQDCDWLRLRKAARGMLHGTRLADPAELLQEALARALSGDRDWPRGVPFLTFVTNAARSIADGLRHAKSASEVLESDLPTMTPEDAPTSRPFDRMVSSYATPERLLLNEEERLGKQRAWDALRGAFQEDVAADCVLRAIEEELTPEQARQRSRMSRAQYDAARKRLSRWIEKRPTRKIAP